jgi:hypothetical protein
VLELGDGGGHFEAEVEDFALALEEDVLGPAGDLKLEESGDDKRGKWCLTGPCGSSCAWAEHPDRCRSCGGASRGGGSTQMSTSTLAHPSLMTVTTSLDGVDCGKDTYLVLGALPTLPSRERGSSDFLSFRRLSLRKRYQSANVLFKL